MHREGIGGWKKRIPSVSKRKTKCLTHRQMTSSFFLVFA
ncbi:hypothetical protein NG271_377 [Saccharomyces cerevisiae synthetic construct]|uniref:Uncharacterized protein YDR118W-A n=2 Tax=Saccharomyces cerevisiae TaxID=4932 RepID=YD18A_YEAST|nr:RecName: Full=Uncharacterized protein YDR118W-A [Saccharomyces cerevisiae S288C]EWG87163.1 hypothetical protein R008_D12551 [Saccharomyces cerevisiae R008]EWG97081.1 hypothetical protein R103_D22511 [Saccharomyces cerevisiae R103]WNF19934.1 hypothetical protein NG271_377 [Saccharomyces cerevisiae synthetic construct]CAY78623.1 EC1118_1D0_3719p [Saccharomyces cerevisiae EC1118]